MIWLTKEESRSLDYSSQKVEGLRCTCNPKYPELSRNYPLINRYIPSNCGYLGLQVRFRVSGLGFGVFRFEFQFWGSGFGFKVQGLGLKILALAPFGFRL